MSTLATIPDLAPGPQAQSLLAVAGRGDPTPSPVAESFARRGGPGRPHHPPEAPDPCPSASSADSSSVLPALSPHLAAFVDAWLQHSADTIAVAAHLKIRPHEVLRFLSHPLVQHYLDLARAAANDRGLAIARRTLESAINATDSPVEKRRAATTLSTLCRRATGPRATGFRGRSKTHSASAPHAPASNAGANRATERRPESGVFPAADAAVASSPGRQPRETDATPSPSACDPSASGAPAIPARLNRQSSVLTLQSSALGTRESALTSPPASSAVPSSASPASSSPLHDHALTCSPAHALTPPPSPASSVPGLRDRVERFIAAAGRPDDARRLIAVHRRDDLGEGVNAFIASVHDRTRGTRAIAGIAAYDDECDTAVQYVRLVYPDGRTADALVSAVLERVDGRTPRRWAITDLTTGSIQTDSPFPTPLIPNSRTQSSPPPDTS